MVKQITTRYSQIVIPGVYLLLSLLIWLLLMHEFRLDDSFITYRYARNLNAGLGLVYNHGDVILSTTAPLYAILLALLNHIIPDLHILGSLIGAICIGAGGWIIFRLLPQPIPAAIRIWAGLLYCLSTPLWLALGMETALWIFLVLMAIWLAQENRWWQSGLTIGLAVLTRPDAALPGVLLGFTVLITTIKRARDHQQQWWRTVLNYTIFALIPLGIFVAWSWIIYGSPFPVTLDAKSAQATLGITGLGAYIDTWTGLKLILRSLMNQSSLYIVFALLALFGLAGGLSSSVLLVTLWSTFHLLAYILMGVAPYRWYYAPLVPGLILLAACGLYYLKTRLTTKRPRIATLVVFCISIFPLIAQLTSFARIADTINYGGEPDPMLPIVDWKTYQEAGEWLNTETPKTATVGVAEVGQVGFYANRWMTDYLGLLQPEVTEMLRRGDLYSWLIRYAPDYLVFQRFRGAPLVLYNYLIGDDLWFKTSYQSVAEFDDPRYSSGPVTIFHRMTPLRTFSEQSTQLDFGGLRLVGVATDGVDLPITGATVRVRLDWQITGSLPLDLHIAVKALDIPDNPGFDGDYQTQHWKGSFSTWHGFVIPAAEPGGYRLQVAVGPKGGPYQAQNAGWFDISFSKRNEASIEQTLLLDSEEQLQLLNSSLNQEEDRLVINWRWRAAQNLTQDYTFFIHLVPDNKSTSVTQVDGQPLDGNYPTHLWQVGEIVPMQIHLNQPSLHPGTYLVIAGWYVAPNGPRLVTPEGKDSVLLGKVVVSSEGSAIISSASN